MRRILFILGLAVFVGLGFASMPRGVLLSIAVLVLAINATGCILLLADLLLGCEDDPNRSDSGPMTANIPAEAAMALGLSAPGDEAYIEVTEVNSDGSVVVMAEMEEAEDSAPPPAAGPALPPELGKMLGT